MPHAERRRSSPPLEGDASTEAAEAQPRFALASTSPAFAAQSMAQSRKAGVLPSRREARDSGVALATVELAWPSWLSPSVS